MVPNTTDRSVGAHPNAFDLCLGEGVRNGEGRGGNCFARTELDRSVPPSTELGPCHPRAILVV